MATAKTRAALKNQSDTTFPSDTAEIVAVEHREFNEDSDASALNIVDPAAQIIVSKVDFAKQITAIGGLGKLTSFTQSIKADMQGVVPDLAQTGAWNFVKDPSVVDDEGLKNGLTFLFIPNGDAINFSVDFDVTSDVIVAGSTYIFAASWRGTKFSVNMTRVGTRDYIDFVPQDPIPSFRIARMFYDKLEFTWTFFNDIEGISLQLGEELRARLENDTGATLLDGKAVAVIGAVGALLQVELLDTSQLDSSIRGFGLMTHTVINGNPGYAVRYGAVRGLDTSFCVAGSILYGDPDTPGDLTATRPKAPNYPVRLGICLISDASQGVIAVDTLAFNGSDTTVNIEGQINGMVTQTPNIAYDASSGDIIATVTNEAFPTKKLPLMIDGVRYLLDTITSPQTIIIPPGLSSAETEESILYIKLNAGVPELAVTTSSTISEPFAILSVQTVFNVARTNTDGKPLLYRRYNNAMDSLAEGVAGAFGLISVIANWIRLRGASGWTSGQDPTPTVNDTNIKLAMTAGEGGQLHRMNLPAFDGNNYLIYNDPANAITYQASTNLTDITETSAGVTLLANNVYYPIKLYYLLNSNGVGDEVIATRPSNFYTTPEEAQADALKYGTSLADPKTELNTYAVYTMVIGRTGGGGATIALIELQNNRTRTLKGGDASGAGVLGGTDDKVRVSAADTVNNHLNDKLTVSSRLIKTIVNPSGDEELQIELGLEPNTWYLNNDGDDANDGSPEKPFKNPQAAHDAAAEGDILFFQGREYFSTQNVTVTKRLTLKGSIPANDNDIAAPFIGGTWDIAAGKDLMVINLWIAATFTHPSVSWFLQCTGCHLDFELPTRKTKLILNDCLWELGSSQDLYSLLMINSTSTFIDTISIGREFTIKGSEFFGSLIAGIDASSICTLKNASIGGAVTITGDLNKTNAVVVGTETVSGTPTSRQAKVFDDNVLFKGQATVQGTTISFTATPTFNLDDGNVQKMIITANVTSLTVSNELDSGSYRVYLTENGTGGYTIPTPDSSWGDELENSAPFETGADAVNIIDLAVDPDGNKFYSVNVKP